MRSSVLSVLAAITILAAACSSGTGGDEAAEAVTTSTSQPATTTSTTTEAVTTTEPVAATVAEQTTTTTLPEGPIFVGADDVPTSIADTSRIVSLNGDLTEIIFELGFGDRVVAVDVTTTYPAEAVALPSVGFARQLAAEPVLAFEPTLVIGDQQIEPLSAIEQLRAAAIPVAILKTATNLGAVAEKIRSVAEILGAEEAGEELVARVDAEVEEAAALAATAAEMPTVAFVYVRGPETVLLFGNGMPTKSMIVTANAVDVGADLGVFFAEALNPEKLVEAAPEVIVLPEQGLQILGGPEALVALPGIAGTPAAQTGRFLAYEEGLFLGMGPRVGQALQQFVIDLHPELGG